MRTYESLARVGEEDGKDKFLINYELIAHLLGTHLLVLLVQKYTY